jgi:hypothetical protein
LGALVVRADFNLPVGELPEKKWESFIRNVEFANDVPHENRIEEPLC